MKKIILSLFLVVVLTLSLVSCITINTPPADMPYIGENGNWWVGDMDTGVQAQGPQGEQGIPGKDGLNGTDGKDGIDGKDGGNDTNCASHSWYLYTLSTHTINNVGTTICICENCGASKFVYEQHTYYYAVQLTLPTYEQNGVVIIGCDCGDIIELEIPSLDNSELYNIVRGHCMQADVYSYLIIDDELNVACEVTFEIENNSHSFIEFSEESIANGEWKLIDSMDPGCGFINDSIYYPLCQNGCGFNNAFELDEYNIFVDHTPTMKTHSCNIDIDITSEHIFIVEADDKMYYVYFCTNCEEWVITYSVDR